VSGIAQRERDQHRASACHQRDRPHVAKFGSSVEPSRRRTRCGGMAGNFPSRSDGLDAALAIHLTLYCAVAACFGLGLFVLMQPSRGENPGLAAYKPPPATAMTISVPPPRDDSPEPGSTPGGPMRVAAAAQPQPAELSTSGQSETKRPERAAKSAKAKRPRTASRKQRRNPMMDYAAQPFGGFRPWF